MSFVPLVPLSGLAGWRFVQKTHAAQLDRQAGSAEMARDTAYFRANIAKVETAEDLVADRTLQKVALGAFGLQDDLNNKAFIRQILETAPGDRKGLANRLSDPRYKALNAAMGLDGALPPKTRRAGFASSILEKYAAQSFERAVGEVDEDMRLALAAKRELQDMASQPGNDKTKWFRVMGQPPLRRFFEVTLGLPRDFGKIDVDQQQTVLADKTKAFGIDSFADFADLEKLDRLTDRFHLRAQIDIGAQMDRNQIALTLLGS
jgi:hypothetical protein